MRTKRGTHGLALLLLMTFMTATVAAGVAEDFQALLNKERARLGKEGLSLNSQLTTAAYEHAQDMAENNYFSHTSRDGTRFATRIIDAGYSNYVALGENIAYHYGSANAEKVFTMWKNSRGHYQNMVSSNFNEVGLGVYEKNGYTYYVQDLGGRKITQQEDTQGQEPSSPPQTEPKEEDTDHESNGQEGEQDTAAFNFELDVTKTLRGRYVFVKVMGNLDERSMVEYTFREKTRRVCSSCTRFRASYTFPSTMISDEGLPLTFVARTKAGDTVTKTVVVQ